MSFFVQFYEKINPELQLRMNDVIFLMVTSFMLGQWFQQRRKYKPSYKFQSQHSSGYPNDVFPIEHNSDEEDGQQNIEISNVKENNVKEQQNEKDYLKTEDQILLQKIRLQGDKIEERGVFEILFERSPNNQNFVRKIQRHEIISDYILKSNNFNGELCSGLVSLTKQCIIPDQKSMLEISYFKNYKNEINSVSPMLQKRIINFNQKPHNLSNFTYQNGKFKKMFRGQVKIGKGGFGTVLEATNIIQSKKYAIKKILVDYLPYKNHDMQKIISEIQVLSRTSHPNIVKYHTCWLEYATLSDDFQYGTKKRQDQQIKQVNFQSTQNIQRLSSESIQSGRFLSSYEDNDIYVQSQFNGISFQNEPSLNKKPSMKRINSNKIIINQSTKFQTKLNPVIYIQMELCQNNLAFYLRNRDKIDRKLVFQIMEGLFKGVRFLHTNKIVHRDLKPQNILFTQDSDTVKIGDFGLSLYLEDQNSYKFERAGTPAYIAPEIYKFSKGAQINPYLLDIYSLGVIYYQLLSTFDTAHERSQKLLKLKQGKVVGIKQFKLQQKLIKSMIQETKRPFIEQLLSSNNYLQLQNQINLKQ